MCILPDTPPVSTLPLLASHSPHIAETGSDETGLVNFLPLATPIEPRFPFQHLGVKGDTGLPVVNLLAPEALVARHERRTGQLAASTVGRFGVIVVRHVFPFTCCVLYVPHYSLLSAYVNPKLQYF